MKGRDSRILAPAQSTALRERLVAELNSLGSADDAAHWARRSLPEKQRLIATDEQAVEEAFAAKLATFATELEEHSSEAESAAESRAHSKSSEVDGAPSAVASQPTGIDKSLLAHPEPRRIRDRAHIRYVAQQPCLICGRRPCDAHHLRFAQPIALARKVSDEFTVPLCRGHHRELHRCSDESAWWSKLGIDPTIPARKLWLDTHPLPAHPVDAAEAAECDVSHSAARRIRTRRAGASRANYETKPNPKVPAHDIV